MGDECAICLGDELISPAERTDLSCGHAFHAACLSSWLAQQRSCPLCRAHVPDLPVSMLLLVAQKPHLFGAMRRVDREMLERLFPGSRGTMYNEVLATARRAFLSTPDQAKIELANLLIYMHLLGDARAAEIASTDGLEGARHVAAGIVQWAANGCLHSAHNALLPSVPTRAGRAVARRLWGLRAKMMRGRALAL